jgi:hypothetical protein
MLRRVATAQNSSAKESYQVANYNKKEVWLIMAWSPVAQ